MGHRNQFDTLEQDVDGVENQPTCAIDGDGTQHGTGALREQLPGHNVGVVLHLADEDDIPGTQIGPTPTVCHEVDGLGSVSGEYDFPCAMGIEKKSHPTAGALELIRGLLAELIHAAVDIGIGRTVEGCLRSDDRFGFLGGRGTVEERHWPFDRQLKDGEISPHCCDIKWRCVHDVPLNST